VLENLSAKEVTTEHVLKVLTPIWQVKPEMASRVRNQMEMMLDAAKVGGCVKEKIQPSGIGQPC
jgi:hypothetical protein